MSNNMTDPISINMRKPIRINTAELALGDVFYFTGGNIPHRVIAQGHEAFGYVELGYDADSDYACLGTHEDVWIATPRDKLGEFKVGEKITGVTGGSEIYRITAVGEEYSLVRRTDNCNGLSVEFSVHHSHFVKAVKP